MEWGQLPQNKNCKNFLQWVEHFYTGGYVPLDSGKRLQTGGNPHILLIICLTASMLRVNTTERDKHWDIVWAQSSVL